MQLDSIRENQNKEDLVTTIKMELDAALDEDICIVLVEGQDDYSFVKNIFDENVTCYESFAGKAALEELLHEPDLQRNEIIVIRDRDYMDLAQVPSRMFVYDGCCLEIMLLESEELISSFYHIHYGGNHSKEDYILHMMKELAPYSILREKNEKNGWSINFQKVGLGNLVDEEGKLDIRTLFSRVGQDQAELEKCMRQAEDMEEHQLKNITNGHDICRMLGIFPKKGKKILGEDGVRQVLLSGYRKSDFRKTQLYHDIRNYQNTYDLKYVD